MTVDTKIRSQAQPRLAIVQHGDYLAALDVLESDAPEPYFGMKHSVDVVERFMRGTECRLISVDAPKYHIQRGCSELIGLHRPNWPKLSHLPWARAVYRSVREFRPTHLLMRTGGILAFPTVRWGNRNGVNTLVVMAGYMKGRRFWEHFVDQKLAKTLNHPGVYLAANHRRPAALSTI